MSDLTNSVDEVFESSWWPLIQQRQAAFLAANGRYWKSRPAGGTIPEDGEALAMDQLALTHEGEELSWLDLAPELAQATLRARPTMCEYGPNLGFYVVLELIENGNLWRRQVDSGDRFNLPWTNMTEVIP